MTSASATPHRSMAIELSHVSQVFGDFVALRDLTLTVPAGSSAVLLGENGAGKSTLLRVVAGLTTPTYGEVRVFGARPREVRGHIAYMGHATMLYHEFTAPENLAYFASLSSPTTDAPQTPLASRVAEALRSVGLDPANPRRVGEYSQGMRQRASLARVLMGEPDLLLLDEPFSNLDADSAQAMIKCLLAFLTTKSIDGLPRTLLLTTHQRELARPLAQTTLVLRAGQIIQPSERERSSPPKPAHADAPAGVPS